MNLREALHEEIRLFLDSALGSDRGVLEPLASDTTFLNERVAGLAAPDASASPTAA